MSESVSTATKTINTQLTSEGPFFATTSNEFASWLSFNLKILFTLFVFCLVLSSLMSLFPINKDDQIIFMPPKMRCPCQGKCPCLKQTCSCPRCRVEEFSNDELYSYNSSRFSDYQSVPLLAPNDQFKNPENLLFGQANRHIYFKDNIKIFNLEIYCNLFVLEGNVYGNTKTNVNQAYKVYLLNDKTKTKLYLDDLKKDGDGIYKLKMKNENVEKLVKFNTIAIVYSLNNKEQILLQGHFK